jgi:hypothetical protein
MGATLSQVSYRYDQALRWLAFAYKVVNTRGPSSSFRLWSPAEGDDLHAVVKGAERAKQHSLGLARQFPIEQQNVRPGVGEKRQHFLIVGCFADDVKLRLFLEQESQGQARRRLAISDQNAHEI